MKAQAVSPSAISKIGSILISTALVIGFALVQAPLRNVGARESARVAVRTPVKDLHPTNLLQLTVGKSLIVDSTAQIVRSAIANPMLADAVAIDAHELLINGKVAGETTLTLWQEGGGRKNFNLNVTAVSTAAKTGAKDAQADAQARDIFGADGKLVVASAGRGEDK